MATMTREELDEFLRRPLVVSFTTVRPDGRPHAAPVWYEYDGGKFYCWTSAGAVRTRNVHTNPRVALCIATQDEPYKYVLAEGTCEVTVHDVAKRAGSISMRYYGEERGRAFARESMQAGDSVVLVVTPARIISESAA